MAETGLQGITSEEEEGIQEEKEGDRHPAHMRSPPTFQPRLRLCHENVHKKRENGMDSGKKLEIVERNGKNEINSHEREPCKNG